ncbi:MAG: hypothetical protein HY288_01865 [Planctomycetia bacterium]|nr:hypothetical protein [Planctomycetia bacterium]
MSQKLELERPFAEELPPSGGVEAVDAADLNLAEYLNSEKHRHRQSASEFEEVFARWRAAERELQAALESERQAAQRLAEMKSPVAPAAAARPSGTPPSPVRAPSAPLPPVNRQQPSSQPLVLAALLIASVVTAVAVVKLVRFNNGAVFANAAEVSAALALPVVGIVPAVETACDVRPTAARVRRATLLMGEVLLAVLIFATVAYLVQDPSFLWRFCTDPWEGVGGMMRLFGAN